MIGIALRGVRAHPAAYLGSFIAVALAVVLVGITLSGAIAAQRPTVSIGDPELARLATTLLANAAAVAIVAATLVVASTLSYSSAQRRTEFAQLRLAGASASRVGVVLFVEVLVVGVLAALVGSPLAILGSRWFAALMSELGLAPPLLATGLEVWPVLVAAGVGVAAVVLGALPVIVSSSRVPPIAALRLADVAALRMAAVRWLVAALLAGGVALLLPLIAGAEPGPASAYLVLLALVLIGLFVACGPVVNAAIVWLLQLAIRRGPVAVAVGAARGDLRRIGTTVAPILMTVGLAASLLTSTATIQRSAGVGDPNAFADTIAILTVVGLTVGYTGISVAVTLAMSTAGRARELGAVRLAGASRSGLLAIVAADCAVVMLAALLQSAAITGIIAIATAANVASWAVPIIVVPWAPILLIVLACSGLALGAALLSWRQAGTARAAH